MDQTSALCSWTCKPRRWDSGGASCCSSHSVTQAWHPHKGWRNADDIPCMALSYYLEKVCSIHLVRKCSRLMPSDSLEWGFMECSSEQMQLSFLKTQVFQNCALSIHFKPGSTWFLCVSQNKKIQTFPHTSLVRAWHAADVMRLLCSSTTTEDTWGLKQC